MAAAMSTAAAAVEALPPPDAAVDGAVQSLAQGDGSDGSDGGSSVRPLATDCCADSVTDENTPYEQSSFEVVAPQPPPDLGGESSAGFEKYLVWLLVAGLALVLAAFVVVVVWVRKRRATKLLIKNGPAGHGCAERGEGSVAEDDDDDRNTTDGGRTASQLGKTPPTRCPSAARSAKGAVVLNDDAEARAPSGGEDAAAAMAITFVAGTDVGGADATAGAQLAAASATPDIVVGHSTDGAAEDTAGGRGGSRAGNYAAGDGTASAAPPSSNVALLLPLPPQSAAGATMTTVASDGDDAAGRRTGVPSRHRSAASRRTSGAASSAPRTPSAVPMSDAMERATAAAAELAATGAGRSSRTLAGAATATEVAAASRGAGSALAIQTPDPRSPAAFSPDLLQTTTLTASNHTLLSDDTFYGRRKLLTPRTANKMVSELIARNRMREKLEKQERIRNFALRQSEERTKMKLQNWSDEEDDCESDRHGIELESEIAPSSSTA